MSVSLEYFQQCSVQTGYAISPLEKVVRLGEMAADIVRHPFLGKVLALKVERSWTVISPFLLMTDNEARYIASIQVGELDPELLFPNDQEEARRIAAHPAILWKLVNVRDHLARCETKTKPRSF